ncbi:tRNA1(Val) (adenine(37)-N6)-methyltransferase, partial [Brevundimonas aveniformis]|uniref:tRNA1(Val) (adenine(37)-N6)-methyltransferase n=1 Tax=Brevundimonas aveniformis TaxID=370977 RepID=UPI0024910A87
AARRPGASFVGIERTEAAVDLAQRNILANQMSERIEVRCGDIAEGFRPLDLPAFDWAISNPPFFDDANRLRAPAPERRDAWIADDGLAAWTTFLSKAVREGGAIVMIHRADALAEILGQLSPKAGSFQILPIHPFADQPAKRVIIRATKSGKAPLQILPGLVLHDHSGAKHTPRAEALLRGQAEISWR